MSRDRNPTTGRLKDRLEAGATRFDTESQYHLADYVLKPVFTDHPRNDVPADALLKVALLNSLYATQIYAVYRMAEHISSLPLDPLLRKGSYEAVDRIRKGHRIGRKKPGGNDLYSFATKYCHWHRPDVYPMFDWYVGQALMWLNQRAKFSSRFAYATLLDYSTFVAIVDACRVRLDIRWPGYKRLDQALWMLGQEIA